jgi:hypothetical protein
LELARALIARLLPDARMELLLPALLAELATGAVDEGFFVLRDSDLEPPARELRRIRTRLALGEVARSVQHAVNNALTALFAEAQLLQMELQGDEYRAQIARIVELTRQIVAVTRRLDVAGASLRIG